MRASEVLREAKRLIDEPGKWQHGAFGRTRLCMLQALEAVGADFGKPHKLLTDGCQPKVQFHCIINWNDTPGRTHAEVMSAFDRAIALAEADERKAQPWTLSDTRRILSEITEGEGVGAI